MPFSMWYDFLLNTSQNHLVLGDRIFRAEYSTWLDLPSAFISVRIRVVLLAWEAISNYSVIVSWDVTLRIFGRLSFMFLVLHNIEWDRQGPFGTIWNEAVICFRELSPEICFVRNQVNVAVSSRLLFGCFTFQSPACLRNIMNIFAGFLSLCGWTSVTTLSYATTVSFQILSCSVL
jgi:hypothetical protein